MNLLTIEKDIQKNEKTGINETRYHTTENTTVEIPGDTDLNWDEFKYYRDLYITNINTTSNGQYIVTEAARGPKNYLRIWFLPILFCISRFQQLKTKRRESGLFYFVFDPDEVKDYLKTRLDDIYTDWRTDSRCSYLNDYEDDKYHLAECCITDLPEGLRDADIPKGQSKPFLFPNILRVDN